jgi:cytochrome c553
MTGFRMAPYAASLALLVSSGSGGAQQHKPDAVFQKEFQSKAAYCQTCHGVSGQGFRGSFPMPRLAGQQPEYLENQLKSFIEHRRINPVMRNVAHALSPAMVAALSAHFKALDPAPLEGGPKDLVAEGEKIYQEGVPDAEVPPCSACHGEDAKGAGEFPRLAGQLDDYVIGELTNWGKERGLDPAKPDSSAVMTPIAEKLTTQQIAAVAAYLSYLK